VLNAANGRIAYRFHTRDLHLVMGSAARETSVRFRVLIDYSRGAMRLAIIAKSRSIELTSIVR
jgi:Thioredoxin like C-terminal domain